MHLDIAIVLAGLIGGFVIGLTGVGGGALLTPLLILLNVNPLVAVSTDIVASLVLKPVGAVVHHRQGTINWKLVQWLSLGSVPAALAGVYTITHLSGKPDTTIKHILGTVLVIAAAAMIVKSIVAARRRQASLAPRMLTVRVAPTIAIGVVGGFIVGLTSVGSGSLMVVLLMLLYPRISGRELVGTDLVQAIPLVGSAAIGVAFWGTLHLSVAGSLLVGAIPAVYFGARLSSRANDGYLRPVIILALVFSAAKMLELDNSIVVTLCAVGLVLVIAEIMRVRRDELAQRARSSMLTDRMTSPTLTSSATSMPSTT